MPHTTRHRREEQRQPLTGCTGRGCLLEHQGSSQDLTCPRQHIGQQGRRGTSRAHTSASDCQGGSSHARHGQVVTVASVPTSAHQTREGRQSLVSGCHTGRVVSRSSQDDTQGGSSFGQTKLQKQS